MHQIVAFHSATGLGHLRAAEAVAAELEITSQRITTSSTKAELIDAFEELEMPILQWAPALYDSLSRRALWLYNVGWRASNLRLVDSAIGSAVSGMFARRLEKVVPPLTPDLAVITHPLYVTAGVHAFRSNHSKNFPIVTLVSDLVNPHRSWVNGEADVVLVTTEEAEQKVRSYRPLTSVRRVTFPIHPEYRSPTTTPAEGRQRLGLPEQKTVLLTGGGAGGGGLRTILSNLVEHDDFHILAMCGGNLQLLREIKDEYPSGAVSPMGMVPSLLPYYDAADYVVGKAGPATIFESIARVRPLLITAEVGAQERGNAAFAERSGIALNCTADVRLISVAIEQEWQPSVSIAEPPHETPGSVIRHLLP